MNLKDIIGVQEVKDAFMVDVIAPLNAEYQDVFRRFRGDNLQSQYLLYGPPGTGKTHIVRALAGALGAKIAVVQTSEILASVVGVGEKHMRAIFEQASKLDKCVIFFDEIDSLASGRDSDDSRHTKAILTTMLTCMDGFIKTARNDQFRVIIAATNRPWVLDPAIKRGGRFETQIFVPLPAEAEIKMFIERALYKNGKLNVPCKPEVTIEYLTGKLKGLAGADIIAVLKQIANRPLRREILNIYNKEGEKGEAIEIGDCEAVIKGYINPTSPEMLLRFEAYRANMDFAEFIKTLAAGGK
jgi:SpoVK/Ycf46/Vps4 family AAA+-type ATPase